MSKPSKVGMMGHAPSVVIGKAPPPEKEKYDEAYKHEDYRMGGARKKAARFELMQLPRGTLLDVGCGRGEVLLLAAEMGHRVSGVEIVDDLIHPPLVEYGDATDLKDFADQSFDYVTLFDVMEHLPAGDDEKAVKSICRVAKEMVILTIANYPHLYRGVDLHINIRPYEEWDALLKEWAPEFDVEWRKNMGNISETWRLTRV